MHASTTAFPTLQHAHVCKQKMCAHAHAYTSTTASLTLQQEKEDLDSSSDDEVDELDHSLEIFDDKFFSPRPFPGVVLPSTEVCNEKAVVLT